MHKVFIEGGLIRKLGSVETDAYRDHLLRLDPESCHSRFGAAIADDMIRTYAATAPGSDVIVHGFFVDGVLRGAADLRSFGSLYWREAEAAFSIEKPWQSLGIGAALLERSLLAARNRGVVYVDSGRACRDCPDYKSSKLDGSEDPWTTGARDERSAIGGGSLA